MKQIVNVRKSIRVEEVPAPLCGDNEVLVANVYSLISAGTERHSIEMRSKDLFALQREMKKGRPEMVNKVKEIMKSQGIIAAYKIVTEKLNEPNILGYSSAGIVIEIGKNIKSISVGNRVACGGGGYASHADIVRVPENLCVRVPEGVNLKEAAYTTVGAIAMQGVRRAAVQVGEKVAVIGLGLVGLLTSQILVAAGIEVIGFDISPDKVHFAEKLGISAYHSTTVDIFSVLEDFTKGAGVDAVIITASTKSNRPVEDALKMIRKKGKIVVVGAVGMDIPRGPFYEKEGDFLISTSYGPGRYDPDYEERGIDYPIAYVRWTERRNMESFLSLISSGKIDVKPLTTHIFKIDNNAEKAYEVIKNGEGIGVLIEYGIEKKIERYVEMEYKTGMRDGDIRFGIVGAGNFAKKFHLPNLKRLNEAEIYAVATNTGANANYIAKKYGAKYSTTDYRKICKDKNINAVVISTRHDTHKKIATEALRNGKHVFVEKPAAINQEELDELLKVAKDSGRVLMVGVNRRFSPFIQRAKKEIQKKAGPIIVQYRVNAGKLPENHWVYSPEQGGSRIIGEGVHFFDTINYLTGGEPTRVSVESIDSMNQKIKSIDNIIVTIKYSNGSMGVLTYSSIGSKKYPKEHIYIERDGLSINIEDFTRMTIYDRSERTIKKKKQDKGHYEEIISFVKAIKNGKSPMSLQEIENAHRIAFVVDREVRRG